VARVTGTLVAVDPASGAALRSYAESTTARASQAVGAAARAAGDVRLAEPARRASLLRGISSRLGDTASELTTRFVEESGLPIERATAELARTRGQLEAFASAVERDDLEDAITDTGDPDAAPIARPDLRRGLVPIGPVAVFGASNFPFAFGVAGGDTASALAAGCPVVAKGHPSQPGVNELVAECVLDAVSDVGLPAGTFASLQGAAIEIGEALVDAPELEAVAFTGSLSGGRALFDRAARRPRPIPVFAEMGSVNPVLVTQPALADRAEEIASGLVAAVTSAAGQLCTKPGLVFVPAGPMGDRFSVDVGRRLAQVEAIPMLNDRLRDAFSRGVIELSDHRALTALTPGSAPSGPGFRHSPAGFELAVEALAGDATLGEERFGPLVLLARWSDAEGLLAALQALGGQLSAAMHVAPGEDSELLGRVLPLCQRLAGRLVFDGFPTGVAVTWATQHGGPYPATTAPSTTSVGLTAARRFLRPVAWQDAPDALLPAALRDGNPLALWRRVNGELTQSAVTSRGS
jgi:acyl-CoA reductase-like NAD-dependent aldehyde dehydrogenase